MILHLGLPKTATSWWQNNVYPRVRGLDYVHKSSAVEDDRDLVTHLRKYCHAQEPSLEQVTAVTTVLARIRDRGSAGILLSDENLSVTVRSFWNANAISPHRVCDRLVRLRDMLGGPTFRIIIGIRDPLTWIPSRYAESAKLEAHFSQADFDARVPALFSAFQVKRSALDWLDFGRVLPLLNSAFGRDNVLVMPFERFQGDPKGEVTRFREFVGRDRLDPVEALFGEGSDHFETVNGLRQGPDLVWKLKARGGSITVSPEMAGLLTRWSPDYPRAATV